MFKCVNITNPFVVIFLVGTFVSFFIKHCLEFIDYLERIKNQGILPEELKQYSASQVFNQEKLKKISEYENAKYFVWIFSSIVSLVLSVFLVLSGFFPWILNIASRTPFGTPNGFGSTYVVAAIFMILSSIPEAVVGIPFSLYSDFVLEKKFGFSNMTFRLWISDFFKNLLVSLILFGILGVAMIAILCKFPKTWWIFLTCVIFAFTLIMQVVYPLFIAPLFNKFTELEDGELKTKITQLMTNLGFKSTGIFVVDASKRSGHSNAYFTGIGKSKRVVLYDTLIKQLTTDELVAVLGHEFGHYKLKHILRRICVLIPVEFVLMFVLHWIAQGILIYKGFGFAFTANEIVKNQFIGLFLTSLVWSSVSEIVSPITNYFSRRDEYAADAFSAKLTNNPDALINGLIKLNSENLSELLPSKIYVIWNYSHPSLLERIRALKNKS